MIYWIMRALFRLYFRLYGSWKVEGHEHVPKTGPVLVTPNHLSFLDPPLMGCALQRPGWFMAKAELFRVPGFRWLITHMHAYPVRRGGADRAALKRTLDFLKHGEIVCVFPEGTRSQTGELGEIESGIGLLALKSGAPIVPVGIRGTDCMLPRGARWIHRSRVRVRFGPSFQLGSHEGRVDREACEAVAGQVRQALLAVLAEMDGPASPVPPPSAASAPGAPR
jgi:1-acyl-sn-glycerol-3-phosphate acyltransferase